MVRLFHGIHDEWDPANGQEDDRSDNDAEPSHSTRVSDCLGLDMLLRAHWAHAQLNWFSTPIQEKGGVV
eukprot:CAMPEP_0117035554 /NCGR_PEP_ID=MMETSP0472-20121206/25241_1 /TAXON_ID=693140 ORGANISM="Tiarina fusus, Strain LIS" /NCGR_SAMPLE_ID=MMETSP0472 /ASSEMBLY_ACC=CAM_ASM_000603 /LENGTH=68 /DNA_ID=CAMNT_0004745053 /DNA_START=116 /DNA_END=322 /DNA_ORIENTATION=-